MKREDGIRIQPKAHLNWPASASVCVTNHSRPYPQPTNGQRLEDVQPVCKFCGKQHFAKTYVVHLTAGSAIVSPVVWENLRHLDDNPFEYANPVDTPPGQLIKLDAVGARPQLIEKFVMPINTRKH